MKSHITVSTLLNHMYEVETLWSTYRMLCMICYAVHPNTHYFGRYLFKLMWKTQHNSVWGGNQHLLPTKIRTVL